MNKREFELKAISNEFARWQVQIQNLNSLSLYDANLFSESSICEILNSIFDYQLANINSSFKNYPAIDLADDYNKIAVQVTSTNSSVKIQETLNKFFENKLEAKYDELFLLILGNKQKRYKKFISKEDFIFDEGKHIIDFKDLLMFINKLPTKKIEQIRVVLEQQHLSKTILKSKSNAVRVKRNLTLKKRLKKDLLEELDKPLWRRAIYEPYIRFKYHNIIIRSVDDNTWPDAKESKYGEMSTWFKGIPTAKYIFIPKK
ncbi:SMEK domain-containing protein [Cytophagaceae bacterium ABcell3]|nr:SMEK domain-containing protein [Cytophagaceae bacterium ABcell3]